MADTIGQPRTGETAALRTRLLAALNTRAGLRQAIFMAEILAPPVAKRGARSHPPTRASSSSSMGRNSS
jgi:hypothetical protein